MKPRSPSRTFLAYTLIWLTVTASVALMDRLELFTHLEHLTHDLRFRLRGVEEHAPDIVTVGIDSQTLDQLGLTGIPPRSYHVKLIKNLYDAGAKAVLLDILFLTYTGRRENSEYAMSLKPIPSYQDSLLADTLFMYPETVIARKQIVDLTRSSLNTAGEPPLPIPMLQFPRQLAFVDMILDSDKFVRRAQLIHNDTDLALGWQYSFALRAAMAVMEADTAWVDTNRHVAHVGSRDIPLDERDMMIINYPMNEAVYARQGGYIPYEQVLDDSSPDGLRALRKAGTFRDKVVLVGAAYPESRDWESTPFYLGASVFSSTEQPMYGIHIHRSIASTIISGRYIHTVRWRQTALWIALMALLTVLLNYRFGGIPGLTLSILLIMVWSVGMVTLFIGTRILMPIIAPSLATVIPAYIGVMTYNYLRERRQKKMIRSTFSQYVPDKVVQELLRNPDMLRIGGEEREMTVLFSDIADFTSISEKLSPTELVDLLNEYLTAMTDIILACDGIIDKYEGDAIMAEFGAPLPDPEHASKACRAAVEMQTRLAELRLDWRSRGKPELTARIGINSGPMVIGNMGSRRIMDYTVMGDNVNLSARLEGANKVYGTGIMCSEATKILAGDQIVSRKLDVLRVKGRSAGLGVYEILGMSGDSLPDAVNRMLSHYHKGMSAYRECRWAEACESFTAALEIKPDDGPSLLYKDRCMEFTSNPPPTDWDGIFTMRTK